MKNNQYLSVLTFVLLSGLASIQLLAQGPVVITRAVPDLDALILNIEGNNFQTGVRVFMGAVGFGVDELPVLFVAPTRIEAQLLSSDPGSYRLLVINPGRVQAPPGPKGPRDPRVNEGPKDLRVNEGLSGPRDLRVNEGLSGPKDPRVLRVPRVLRGSPFLTWSRWARVLTSRWGSTT